jgi:hypothetical protein
LAEEVLVLVSEDEADSERLETLAGLLRSDLLELDVDDVTALRVGAAPPGSRGWDAATIGGLLVTLGHSGSGLAAVVGVVRAWLTRSAGVRRTVRVEIGGDVLELSQASLADQDRLVSMFVRTHTPGSPPAEGQPAAGDTGKDVGG